MQSINKRHVSFAFVCTLVALLAVGVFFTGCKDDDDSDNGTQVWTVGPGNLERGQNLKVNGQKLDAVTSVILPSLDGSGIEIPRSEFKEVSSENDHFEVTLPQDRNLVSGKVKIKLSDGTVIESKVTIKVGSLVIDKIAPVSAKAGDQITISGEYLSLVQAVVFTTNQIVDKADFVSQTNGEIVVKLPASAQSGSVGVSDGDATVYAADKLNVTLPSSITFESKNYKPGVDKITLKGSDMDLVSIVKFEGADVVSFDSQSATAITLTVPSSAKAGDVYVEAASAVNVKAGTIALVSPVINDVEYKTGVDYYLLGETVTFKGSDLDLVTSIKLGGVAVNSGDITCSADNSTMTVKLAADVKSGAEFSTDNGTSVSKTLKIVPFLIFGTENGEDGGQVNVNCGEKSVLTGINLQYLSSVTVHGYEATSLNVSADGKSAEYVVAAQAAGTSGKWTADGFESLATNGEKKQQSVWAGAPSKPYFLNLPKNAESGTSIYVNGAHFNLINSIKMGSVNVPFSVTDDNNIFLNIPASLEENTYPVEITYETDKVDATFSLKVASSVVVLWSGNNTLGWSDATAGFFKDVDVSELEVGGLIKIYMTQLSNDPAWSYLNFRVDTWNEDKDNWPQHDLQQVAPGEEMVYAFKLTAAQLEKLNTVHIYGEGNTAITKITYGEKE